MATDPVKKKKRVSTVPAGETPAQAFVRLAQMRYASAVDAIDRLGKLATSQYVYTPEQTKKIIDALSTRVQGLSAMFEGKGRTTARLDI